MAFALHRLPQLLILLCWLVVAAGCGRRRPPGTVDDGGAADAQPGNTHTQFFPQGGPDTALDVLFVIDNSDWMDEAQKRLVASFPQMLDTLRAPGSAGDLPSLHIGVVSTDMGAGDFGLPSCEVAGGDGGKLQDGPRVPGCTTPIDSWIAFADGQRNIGSTNIPGCDGDPAACLREAFACLAPLGAGGCGFEAPLEAARRALDPQKNVNPGFRRAGVPLMIVILTNEDDCSARNPQLFDPQQQGLTDPLGPLTSFRCFEFGVQCDVNDRQVLGPRKGCVPAFDWLFAVQDYIDFFGTLAAPHELLLTAIAGPTAPVNVAQAGPNPLLQASCQVTAEDETGNAAPALRLAAVLKAFGGKLLSFCDTKDYGLALTQYRERYSTTASFQCLELPPLLPDGAIACHPGIAPCRLPDCDGPPGPYCGTTCLDRVDCQVDERLEDPAQPNMPYTAIPRCPRIAFVEKDFPAYCGGVEVCPCWRLIPRPEVCTAALGVTPFALQIMRNTSAPRETIARLRCRVATDPWSSPAIQQAPEHCALP